MQNPYDPRNNSYSSQTTFGNGPQYNGYQGSQTPQSISNASSQGAAGGRSSDPVQMFGDAAQRWHAVLKSYMQPQQPITPGSGMAPYRPGPSNGPYGQVTPPHVDPYAPQIQPPHVDPGPTYTYPQKPPPSGPVGPPIQLPPPYPGPQDPTRGPERPPFVPPQTPPQYYPAPPYPGPQPPQRGPEVPPFMPPYPTQPMPPQMPPEYFPQPPRGPEVPPQMPPYPGDPNRAYYANLFGQAGPQIGQLRQFPNGRIGRWDGQGYEHVG